MPLKTLIAPINICSYDKREKVNPPLVTSQNNYIEFVSFSVYLHQQTQDQHQQQSHSCENLLTQVCLFLTHLCCQMGRTPYIPLVHLMDYTPAVTKVQHSVKIGVIFNTA